MGVLCGCFKEQCSTLATFFEFDKVSFIQEMQQLWDHRKALVAQSTGLSEHPLQLGAQILRATADLPIWRARKALGTFLVMQSESAACERVFSRAGFVRENLREYSDGQLVEQYLWIAQGPPLTQAETIIDASVRAYMDKKERRMPCSESSHIYYKGRSMKTSKRKIRSDAGTHGIRKRYSMKKRHARVRSLDVVTGKRCASATMTPLARIQQPPANAAVAGIDIAMSPPRKRGEGGVKVAVSDDDSDL